MLLNLKKLCRLISAFSLFFALGSTCGYNACRKEPLSFMYGCDKSLSEKEIKNNHICSIKERCYNRYLEESNSCNEFLLNIKKSKSGLKVSRHIELDKGVRLLLEGQAKMNIFSFLRNSPENETILRKAAEIYKQREEYKISKDVAESERLKLMTEVNELMRKEVSSNRVTLNVSCLYTVFDVIEKGIDNTFKVSEYIEMSEELRDIMQKADKYGTSLKSMKLKLDDLLANAKSQGINISIDDIDDKRNLYNHNQSKDSLLKNENTDNEMDKFFNYSNLGYFGLEDEETESSSPPEIWDGDFCFTEVYC